MEIRSPICYIAAKTQSVVLLSAKLPPIESLNLVRVLFVAAVTYGLASFTSLSKSDGCIARDLKKLMSLNSLSIL